MWATGCGCVYLLRCNSLCFVILSETIKRATTQQSLSFARTNNKRKEKTKSPKSVYKMMHLLSSVSELLSVLFYPVMGSNSSQAGFLGQGEITHEDEFRFGPWTQAASTKQPSGFFANTIIRIWNKNWFFREKKSNSTVKHIRTSKRKRYCHPSAKNHPVLLLKINFIIMVHFFQQKKKNYRREMLVVPG